MSENSRKLKQLRERSGLSTRALGKLVDWGHTRVQYYEDQFKKDFLPQAVVRLYAPHLVGLGTPPITEAEVYALADMRPPRDGEGFAGVETSSSHSRDFANEGRLLDRDEGRIQSKDIFRDLRYLRSNPDPEWGDHEVDGDLAGLQERRLLRVGTDRMAPRYMPGETVAIERTTPKDGDHVWVELKPSPGSKKRQGMLRLLREQTATTLTLQHYHPKRSSTTIERKKVLAVYRVLTCDDLLSLLGAQIN